MANLLLVLLGAGLWLASGFVALLKGAGERASVRLGVAGSAIGFAGALAALVAGAEAQLDFQFLGQPGRVALDPLSAAFLLPNFLVGAAATVYGQAYWPVDLKHRSARRLRLAFGVLVAALALVPLARQGPLFLTAWEAMALAGYFLITLEDEKPEVRHAGWTYLVATHLGTALLLAMAALLAVRLEGSLWVPVAGARRGLDTAIYVLGLAGFGWKAGLAPLHYWLPGAHASAPSHASAMLSAVMIKMGIYGLLRLGALLPPPPPGLALALVLIGAFSAVYGIFHALGQDDLKRLLAYSSIENLGLVSIGVGLAWTGRALGHPSVAVLGLAGAVLHTWNHALFKSLLFLGAGAVVHATGTRHIDRLGGLLKSMPRAGLAVLCGGLAVAALPPLNGFVGEWMLYRGLFASLGARPWLVGLAAPAMAFAGALALGAFVKLFGIVFLGEPRTADGREAHDPPPAMLRSMQALAGCCLALGLGAPLLLLPLDRLAAAWLRSPGARGLLWSTTGMDTLMLSAMGTLLLMVAALLARALGRRLSVMPRRPDDTWGCGYLAPTPRMQYTGLSLAGWFTELVPWSRGRGGRVSGLFPHESTFHAESADALQEGLVEPRLKRLAERLMAFRRLQHGLLPLYLLYILVALVAAFAWMLLRGPR